MLLAPIILLPLYPPASFDSTMYHLPYAKAFASSGGLPFLSSLRFPVFPQLMEVLFAVLLLFADDVAAQCVQVLMTLLTAGLLFVWGRRAFSPAAGWIAAALFLGNPIVAYFAGTAYVEPGLFLFVTAGLYAASRWRESRGRGWLVLAAVFVSAAAATKYLGLFFVAALGVIVALTKRTGSRARNVLLFAGVCAAFLAPWYGRIFFYTGNPIHPYLPEIFGATAWDLSRYQLRIVESAASPGVAEYTDAFAGRLVSLAKLPWDLVFAREKFDWHPPFSPIYLLALPLMFFAAVHEPKVRRLLLLAAAYAFFFLSLPPEPRYLLPAAPLVSLAAGAGCARLLAKLPGEPRRRRLLAALCLVCFLPGWLYAARHIRHLGVLPVNAEQRERFLARRLPVYPAIRHLNRVYGSGYSLYAFYAENMPYFAEGSFWGDWFGPASFERVLSAGTDPEAIHRTLRRFGVNHLLIVEGHSPPLPTEDPGFRRRFQTVYSDPHARVFALVPLEPGQ